jgi:hypothetical protein
MFVKEVVRLAAKADAVLPDVDLQAVSSLITEESVNAIPFKNLFENKRDEKFEYVQIKPYDADAVVDAVTNGHAVIISFYCTLNEWDKEMEVEDVTSPAVAPVRHFVAALPNSYHTHEGKSWISVIDSSPHGGHHLRHVTVDFLKNRMFLGGGFYYPSKTGKKPIKYIPGNSVKFGEKSVDVMNLQEYLVRNGLMTSNNVTGYYGNITARAVLEWQLKNLENSVAMRQLQGHYWGPRSINRAKELLAKEK